MEMPGSVSATGMNAPPPQSSSPTSPAFSYAVTALALAFASIVLLRAVFPWLLNTLFRRKLRVGRFGLRGIHGLEWNHAPRRDGWRARRTQGKPDELHLRISRVYLSLGWVSPAGVSKASRDGTHQTKSNRSWVTVHAEGVFAFLPAPRHDDAELERKVEKIRKKEEREAQQEREEQEREDKRLQALIQATWSSRTEPSSDDGEANQAHPTSDTIQDSKCSPGEPHSAALRSSLCAAWYFLAHVALPLIKTSIVRTTKALAFCLASVLPAVVSIVDVQVHSADVRIAEADSTLHIDNAGLELSMDLVTPESLDDEVAREAQDACRQSAGPQKRWAEAISSMSKRFGDSARETTSWFAEGLPAGRCSARLRVLGLRITPDSVSPSSVSPKQATVLSMPGLTRVHLGLLLGPSLTLKGQEAVEIYIKTSPIEVDVDHAYMIARLMEERKGRRAGPLPTVDGLSTSARSRVSKHLVQQRHQPAANALAALRALSISIPQVRLSSATAPAQSRVAAELDHPTRQILPEAVKMEAVVHGLHLAVSNSSPSDSAHRKWLGTCGVTNHQAVQQQKLAGRSHSTRLIEYRRAFKIEGGFKGVEVSCRINDQTRRSELLHLGSLQIHARSTWTPFGILPSACSLGPYRSLLRDPNEQAIMVEATFDGVRGEVQLDCAQGLLAAAELFKRQRVRTRRDLHLEKPANHNGDRLLRQVPKVAFGLSIKNVVYRLDSGELSWLQGPSRQQRVPTSSLIARIPSISVACHGSYHDLFARRSDMERRAAWKGFNNDELEWSIPPDFRCQGPGMTSPKSPSGGFSAFVGRMRSSFAQGDARSRTSSPTRWNPDAKLSERAPSRASDSSVPLEEPQSGLTIEQAVQQMKSLQRAELEHRDASNDSRSAATSHAGQATRSVKVPGHIVRKASTKKKVDANINFGLEFHGDCPVLESFFVFPSDQARNPHGTSEMSKSASSSPGDSGPDEQFSRKPLFSLTNFEVDAKGLIPGADDILTEQTTLRARDHQTMISASLEEIDVEFWHPVALAFTKKVAQSLSISKRFSAEVAPEAEEIGAQAASETTSKMREDRTGPNSPDESPVISRIPGGLDAWVSVGSFLAHVGGHDQNCDPHISRGVGVEAHRFTMDMSCQTQAAVLSHPSSADWGHRSALQLPEDVRVSSTALATRHGKAAVAKIAVHDFGLFPLLDVEAAAMTTGEETEGRAAGHAKRPSRNGQLRSRAVDADETAPAVFADAIWSFENQQSTFQTHTRRHYHQEDHLHNFIIHAPYLASKIIVRPPGSSSEKVGKHLEEVSIVSDGIRLLSLKFELLHTYCLLLAFATLKGIGASQGADKQMHADGREQTEASKASRKTHKSRQKPTMHINFEIEDTHLFVNLPDEVRLFVHARRLTARRLEQQGFACSWESLMMAVESPRMLATNLWEEALRLRDWTISIRPPVTPADKIKVIASGDGASIRIPFGYAVHPIIDAASVSFKAIKQLVHQLVVGGRDSIITPVGEEPKHVPHIELHVRVLTIEAQDDPFETRLNVIWRTGCDESRARVEREEAFEAKVAQLKSQNEERSKAASRSTVSLASSRTRSVFESSDEDESVFEANSDDELASSRPVSTGQLDEDIKSAKERLDAYNASSWIRRYANARAEQARREEAILRRTFGRYSSVRQAVDLPIEVAQPYRAAPLLRSSITGLKVVVGPTSFPETELRDWLHQQGRGTPRDLPYSLLVPLNIELSLAEWIVELRDYPLPLLHIPPIRADQDRALPAFKLSGDICLAEHLSEGQQSIRHVRTVIVPAASGRTDSTEYGISVPKVTMPVKFYGSPVVDFNSVFPTRFTWGQSLQPAISDVVRVFDGITSPPPDPSPKLGFWDKLPLVIHGQFLLRWNSGGELHLYLKGSRDPYSVVGNGAGWVMCWRKKVQVRIGFDNEDGEFLQFLSDEYVLAIPDLRDCQARDATGLCDAEGDDSPRKDTKGDKRKSGIGRSADAASQESKSRSTELGFDAGRNVKEVQFSKICMQLTHGVRWGASLRHEHTCRDGKCQQKTPCQGSLFHRECRFFDRRPHWTVIQRSREHMDTLPEDQRDDSFYSWRSDFSHLGISIYSPEQGLQAYGEKWGGTAGTNNLYFSPLAWQHFWAWLRLFDSTMSLPVRQGKLFPNTPPPSPKFGRQLGTIKYRFDVAPLFISHLYPQFSRLDWASGTSTQLGIKARLGIFHLDMHQRLQEMVKERPETQEMKRGYHKPFYEAEADLGDIDLRALIGRFVDPEKRLVPVEEVDGDDDFRDILEAASDDQTGTSSDRSWYDVQDFVEVDTVLASGQSPVVRLLPTLTCPRFNFYRRYNSRREHEQKAKTSPTVDESIADQLERTKFGNECPQTHTCLIGQAPNAHQIQMHLADERLDALREELNGCETANGEPGQGHLPGPGMTAEESRTRIRLIEEYKVNISRLHDRFAGKNSAENRPARDSHKRDDAGGTKAHKASGDGAVDLPEMYQDWDTFDDRFFVHNPVFFFTNETRKILLRYYASSKKRKGFIHNMTSRSIVNIRQLSEHLNDRRSPRAEDLKRQDTASTKAGSELLIGLLNDTMHYMIKDVPGDREVTASNKALLDTRVDPHEGISDEYTVRRANVCVFLKPQIVMKSNIDDAATIVVTATRIRLQNYSVLDPTVADEDSVNRRVLTRNYFSLDGLQAFHPKSSRAVFGAARVHERMVFVPLETLIDVKYETRDFDRVVSRTDASLRYDRFNRLRLNDSTRPLAADVNDNSQAVDHLRHHMDLLRVRCPRFATSANSTHFGAMYNIVTDLILYRAPTWREHSRQLEAMLLSYDFRDTALLADVVADLQVRIRRAVELDAQYQLRFHELNDAGRLDLFDLKRHLQDLIEELLLITEAITASEDAKSDEKDKKSALRLEAHSQEISWNMMGEADGQLLAKLCIKGPSFTWLNKADNSAANSLSIADLAAVNVHPDATFPEIISKWNKAPDHPMAKQGRMINAIWSELAPVGGISIVDQFELELHPVKVQLEMKVGRMIMDYIFGSKRRREREDEKRKKLLEEAASESESKTAKRGPLARLRAASSHKATDSESIKADKSATEGPKGTVASEGGSQDSGLTISSEGSAEGVAGQGLAASSSASSLSSRRTSMSSDGGTTAVSKTSRAQSDGRATPDAKRERTTSRDQDGDHDTDMSIEHSQHAIAKRNAEEMRQRASSNLTFIFFKLSETVFSLSYKGEKDKSITDVYDLVFNSPSIEYRNRTWAYEELVQHMKKDILRAAWGQRTTILKSILSHRPKRPEALKNIREKQAWLRRSSRDSTASAPNYPQLYIHPPTPHGSRDITPSDIGGRLRELHEPSQDDDDSVNEEARIDDRGDDSPHADTEKGASSPAHGANSDPSHRQHMLSRLLHPRMARSVSSSSADARSLNVHTASDGHGSSTHLSVFRSLSPQRTAEHHVQSEHREGSPRDRSPLRAVSSFDKLDPLWHKGKKSLLRQSSSGHEDGSLSTALRPGRTQEAGPSRSSSGSGSSKQGRMLSRKYVSRESLRGAYEEQRPPAPDADAEEKANALFGSSRSRD
ncbi:unnamed protein product [Parajaminaea phylloscopi]